MHHDADANRTADGCTAEFECDPSFNVVEDGWCTFHWSNIRETPSDLLQRAADGNAAGGSKPGCSRADHVDGFTAGQLPLDYSGVGPVHEERLQSSVSPEPF